jgi:hypothetical protein
LAYATASEAVLRAAFWAGIASLAVSAAMLLAVLLLRVSNSARARYERSFTSRWHDLLAQCAAGMPAASAALRPADGYLFLKLWNGMHESLRGDAKEPLNALARSLGADRIAIAYLGSKDVRKELIGILTLGNLRERRASDAMQARLAHRSPAVSLRAAQALLRMEGDRALPRVLQYASQRVDWPLPRVINVLRELDSAQVSASLAEAIDAALGEAPPGERAARLLRLHETAQPELLRPTLQRALAESQDVETLAAALAALRHPDDIDPVRRLTSHEDWRVRLQAAHALRRLGAMQDLPDLVRLLCDPNWWVRYRAAQAIAAVPEANRSEIEDIAARLTDRFAKDALRHAMAEVGRA